MIKMNYLNILRRFLEYQKGIVSENIEEGLTAKYNYFRRRKLLDRKKINN